jgi:signal transduction histidine kinase
MAQVVGHEIRNPLAVINNSAYFLKAKLGEGVDVKVAKHLGIISSEVTRADALIEDIQTAFRRPFAPVKKPVPWAEMVGEAKATKKFSGEAPLVDPKIMADVIKRLIQNAVEAGGAVTLAGDARGLVIKDSGPGFPAEILPLLFEPFVTTKAKNLGLGLYICKKAVEAHGGKLTVEKPSTVRITL